MKQIVVPTIVVGNDDRSIHPQGWVPVETVRTCAASGCSPPSVAFTPKGGCPLKLLWLRNLLRNTVYQVAFTPKGGCPLKLAQAATGILCVTRSIHPQGWVPVETIGLGCPATRTPHPVAFTPKGGCPLKLTLQPTADLPPAVGSIHPQGWVPVETCAQRAQYRRRRIAP